MGQFEYEETISCVCGNSDFDSKSIIRKKHSWGEITFVQCRICGSWCQSPPITFESLRKWFNSSEYQGSAAKMGVTYINYINDEVARIREAKKRYQQDLAEILPRNSKVLEIGCSTGSLLSVLRDNGCEVTGIDLSPKFAKAAKRLNEINVILGEANEIDLPKNYFDSIILFGTIGNLRNLPTYLNRFRILLKKEGFLIFNFVDAESPIVKYFYHARFWMYTASVHCFMSRRGCELALNSNGFRIVAMHPDKQRPSLQKLFHHARLGHLVPLLERLRLNKSSLPFSLPMPGINFVKAQPIH